MAKMCALNEKCGSSAGLCGHEKAMMIMVVLAVLAGIGHFALNLF